MISGEIKIQHTAETVKGVFIMTVALPSNLRWRVVVLQVVLVVILAFSAGVGYWASSFVHDQVRSQLSSQQIVFPPANSAAIKALPPADAKAMRRYAGQVVTTGDQAHTYAEHFIAVHLKEIGQGKTYAYWSGKALAEQKTNPKQFAIDNNIALTLFRGETLRALLDEAWGFWFVGDIALYAAIGLTVGAVAVFLALLFELLVARRQEVSLVPSGSERAKRVAS
jgi:hypothetical protein